MFDEGCDADRSLLRDIITYKHCSSCNAEENNVCRILLGQCGFGAQIPRPGLCIVLAESPCVAVPDWHRPSHRASPISLHHGRGIYVGSASVGA